MVPQRNRAAVFLLVAVALFVNDSLGQDSSYPAKAEELKRRSYALARLPDGRIVAGSTFGVVQWTQFDPTKDEQTLQPTRISVMLPDSVNDLHVVEGSLFAAIGPSGIAQIDFSTESLRLVRIIKTPGAALDLASSGSVLFVAMGTLGVGAIRIGEPEPSVQTIAGAGSGYTRHVMVDADYSSKPRAKVKKGARYQLWVANSDAGVEYLLLDSMLRPVKQTTRNLGSEARRLAVMGNGLLVGGTGRVCYIDRASFFSNKASYASCVETRDVVRDIVISGSTVLGADGGFGIIKIDWSDPLKPVVSGHDSRVPYSCNRLLLEQDFVLASADAAGVVVLRLVPKPVP